MKAKPVVQIDPTTNKIVGRYVSLSQAAALHYISVGSIFQCCKGKTKTAAGYVWKYAEVVK